MFWKQRTDKTVHYAARTPAFRKISKSFLFIIILTHDGKDNLDIYTFLFLSTSLWFKWEILKPGGIWITLFYSGSANHMVQRNSTKTDAYH